MLYTDNDWYDYITYHEEIGEIENFYLNIRNICRYIKSNNIPIKHHKRPFLSKEIEYDYIDLGDMFGKERVSYYYRHIIERFDPNNINDLDTFFNRVDEFSDFILFLQFLYNKIILNDYQVAGLTEPKIIEYKNSKIKIDTSVIEQFGKSGSVILDLLDSKNSSNKYITFYELELPTFSKKFISGEIDTKLSYKEKVVISDYTDNLSLYMYQSFKKIISDLFENINKYRIDIDYLEKGIIMVKEYL